MTPLPSAQPAAVRSLIATLLAAYFEQIDRFRVEQVPATGPVLFVSNHPGSLTDAFLIGTSVQRPVHFVASVKLFRVKWSAWLLTRCGVIPINRKQDDPTKMATVAQTFEQCFAVLERRGAVCLFPEGVTYDDARLKEIKSGAARLSLEIENRHHSTLGLVIVPAGLTYSAKERFRSRALVQFGEPLKVAAFLEGYERDPRACVRRLSAAIEERIRALILDTPTLEHERIVAAVRCLYLERLRSANLIVTEPLPSEAETLVLTRAMASALGHFERTEPKRVAAFVAELDRYERLLRRLGLSDQSFEHVTAPPSLAQRALVASTFVVSAPFALFGWLHHLLPAWLVGWSLQRFTPVEYRKSQTPLTVMVAGPMALVFCYVVYVALAWLGLGARWALVYAVTLPVSGLVAHEYLRALRRYGGRLRTAGILLQVPLARRALVASRRRLIDTIEAFRADYARTLVPSLDSVLPAR
jgi:glycerol-3-phosphate O-acyltransferase / dihydroxyacetone phosphate acyltransferase